jgi:hypothetical protein
MIPRTRLRPSSICLCKTVAAKGGLLMKGPFRLTPRVPLWLQLGYRGAGQLAGDGFDLLQQLLGLPLRLNVLDANTL